MEEIAWVEREASTEKLIFGMFGETASRAFELYAVLLSFLRHRPAKLVKGCGREQWL